MIFPTLYFLETSEKSNKRLQYKYTEVHLFQISYEGLIIYFFLLDFKEFLLTQLCYFVGMDWCYIPFSTVRILDIGIEPMKMFSPWVYLIPFFLWRVRERNTISRLTWLDGHFCCAIYKGENSSISKFYSSYSYPKNWQENPITSSYFWIRN